MVSFRFRSSSLRARRVVRTDPDSTSGLALVSAPPELPPQEDGNHHGGWHASSLELRRGLDVIEDVPAELWPPEFKARLPR